MEEQDAIVQQKLSRTPYFRPQWQRKSYVDPRNQKNHDKWEQALLFNKEKVLLKYYGINLKKMLQVSRKFRDRELQVKRPEESRFMMEMPEPKVIVRNPKTMNEAFGSIQHFLDYLVNRTPAASSLYLKLTKLQLDCQGTQFEDVIQEVLLCIKKGAEARQKASKGSPSGRKRNFLAEARDIIKMICQNSSTVRDFLKSILKVYTMESFICYWLNELLRSENWEEINIITPYLVCLVYTFKLQEFIIPYEAPKGRIKTFLGYIRGYTLYLYRGAALSKEHLELYDPLKVKYFSWNGVTSTSRNLEQANKFVYLSFDKAKGTQFGVIFKIETDFGSIEDCEGMIDLSKNSRYPHEQEVILAPGTVFELIKTRLMPNNIYEISLKVRKRFQERKTKIPLLGILFHKAIQRGGACIKRLPSLRSMQLLELLRGNKLIREITIRNSEIDYRLMEKIENLRLTTHVKRNNFSIYSSTIFVSSLSLLARGEPKQLDFLLQYNDVRFKKDEELQSNLRNDWRIKEVTLNRGILERFQRKGRLNELWELMKNETQLRSVKVSFGEIQIEDEEFRKFIECLHGLQSLDCLDFQLNQITGPNLNSFCRFIESTKTLRRLSLSPSGSGIF